MWATSLRMRDQGTRTSVLAARAALRMQVRKSARGSVCIVGKFYQEALVTPGISPRRASSRKAMRLRPNLRMYARRRPERAQRLYLRVENFGVRFCLTIQVVLAIRFYWAWAVGSLRSENGMPKRARSSLAS